MHKADIKELVKDVLSKGYLMSLGVVDQDGVWVSDVIYVYDDDLNIYWMSDPQTRHSQAIDKNNKVAGTITISGQGENNLGIQFEGLAEKIDVERYDLVKKHYKKRNKPEPKENDDVLDGDFWYVLKPNKIGLICEEQFGFERQDLNLKYV